MYIDWFLLLENLKNESLKENRPALRLPIETPQKKREEDYPAEEVKKEPSRVIILDL